MQEPEKIITKEMLGDGLRRIFEALQLPENSNGVRKSDLLDAIYPQAERQPWFQRYATMLGYSISNCKKCGWLFQNNAGLLFITDDGIAAYKEHGSVPWILQRSSRTLADKIRRNLKVIDVLPEDAQPDTAEEYSTAEPTLDDIFDQARGDAAKSIKRFLSEIDPYEFQSLVADLINAMGGFVEWIAPPGPDGGIDIIANTDHLGINGHKIKVQVKRQAAPVSESTLKSFMCNLGSNDSGVFVCTGGFVTNAAKTARLDTTHKITLIDMERLIELWIAAMPNLSDEAKRRFPLTPVYFLTTL